MGSNPIKIKFESMMLGGLHSILTVKMVVDEPYAEFHTSHSWEACNIYIISSSSKLYFNHSGSQAT